MRGLLFSEKRRPRGQVPKNICYNRRETLKYLMKLLSASEIIKSELDRLGLNLVMAASPEKMAAQAKFFENIGVKVPMIGGYTELESLLLKWIQSRRQQQAAVLHLAELQLADQMITELEVPETDAHVAIATCLQWVAGEMGGQYRFVKWLADHGDDITAILNKASDWTWDYCRLMSAAVFLCCRVEDKNWTEDFLLSRNLLTDVEALMEAEASGLPVSTEELETLEDLKKPSAGLEVV